MSGPSTGIPIHPDCVLTFQKLKLEEKYKFVIFRFNDDHTEVIVDKTSTDPEWDKFVSSLPKGGGYAVYDFSFEREGQGQRNMLIFITWVPPSSRIKSRMLLAASRNNLRNCLNGIQLEIRGSEPSEIYTEIVKRGEVFIK